MINKNNASNMTEDLKSKLSTYRLNNSEYEKICDLLGRPPEGVEWALFSALWSEHCSYKSSRRHLKKFFSESKRLVQGFGENAGVIDLGEGERVAFKMESHNHPSFIEPYQGAATGVGGILRDIFTMGARPIALANYLCFGKPEASRMSDLVSGVVHGISGYGNCVGVPNITGQVEFHESYDENILVNAFALGYFGKNDVLVTSKAKGVGNLVVYVGAKTGRDGIHGASMASESFEEGSESKRPTIQIGDPFFEKLLIESCIDVIGQNLVVAIQDMGAAGLTSSSFEMASKGGVGFKMFLDQVPLRDSTLSPEDILLSESQERMLLICEPRKLKDIQNVFKKWNLDATSIGEVTEDKDVKLYWHSELICSIDPNLLTENAPNYDREYSKEFLPQYTNQIDKEFFKNSAPQSFSDVEKIFSSLNMSKKNWIYDQYDQRVGARTLMDCSQGLGVIVLPESHRTLGVSLGCRPYVMRTHSYIGSQDSIFYPAIELAIKGLEPLAVTDCLNYGNPEKTNVMTDFVASVEGMSLACKSLKAPVISGNVSFYNETRGVNITPTPSTGLVGLGLSPDQIPGSRFNSGDLNLFLFSTENQLALSGKFSEMNKQTLNFAGKLLPEEISEFISVLIKICSSGLVQSSKAVGAFGVYPAVYKMTEGIFGADLEVSSDSLFQEKLYQVILAVPESDKTQFLNLVQNQVSNSDWTFELKLIGKSNSKSSLEVKNADGLGLESLSLDFLNSLTQKSWTKNFPELI
jgi:phosphoribosylformylglycinamidine synthase subunit PurL